jgi:RimJ/RimL family protein N-acetyltransferase
MEIRPGQDADVPTVVALLRAADDARVLSEAGLRHQQRTRQPAARVADFVAVDDERVVACGACGLNIWTSTPGAAWAFVTVAADRRREGIASAVGEVLLDHLRSVDASKVTSFIRQTEEGERWATARGFSRVITGPLIALDPRAVPEPELPDGFRCVTLAELTPEAVYEPMAEAALDEPTVTPNDTIPFDDFVREWNDPDLDLESSSAVLDGDRVAAFAFIQVAGNRAQHGFTGTARAYRGKGLATAAKRHTLRAVAARGVERVVTSNAEQNSAMRAINRRLGFEQIGEHVILSRDL